MFITSSNDMTFQPIAGIWNLGVILDTSFFSSISFHIQTLQNPIPSCKFLKTIHFSTQATIILSLTTAVAT